MNDPAAGEVEIKWTRNRHDIRQAAKRFLDGDESMNEQAAGEKESGSIAISHKDYQDFVALKALDKSTSFALTAAAEQLRERDEEIEKLQAENSNLRRFKNEVIGARVMLSSGIILATEEQKKSTLFIQAFKAAKGLQASLDKLEQPQ